MSTRSDHAGSLMKGNEASVRGALLAGCSAFFGYPITPASEIAHSAALLFPKLDRIFLQAESEIAAINMVLGASAAGRRAMTASSGPGISLKQEGVSFLAGCELPAVIVDVTRGGPGLGNIGPEQGDYNQVVKGGGHGNYKCAVLAPSTAQEMCDLTMLAFDLADTYRTPTYVMADGVVGQIIEPVVLPPPRPEPPLPPWALADAPSNWNNHITSIYLDHDDLEAVNDRLQRRYAEMARFEQRSESFLCDGAEILLVGFGVVGRILRTLTRRLRAAGVRAGMFRPISLFPFPVDALEKAAATANAIACVELSNGQMIDDVRLSLRRDAPIFGITRMGGNIPTCDEIVEALRRHRAI